MREGLPYGRTVAILCVVALVPVRGRVARSTGKRVNEGSAMSRIQTIQHRGKDILIEDFSNITPGDEYRAAIEEARRFIASRPPKSVLALFDATGSRFNAEALGIMKQFTKDNGPYIKASAVVGIEGILSIALMAVSRFSGRTFKTFKDRPSALDWLVEQ